jgi:hypothetical protein
LHCDAGELAQHAVAGRLNDAAMMNGDGEIDDSRGDVL